MTKAKNFSTHNFISKASPTVTVQLTCETVADRIRVSRLPRHRSPKLLNSSSRTNLLGL